MALDKSAIKERANRRKNGAKIKEHFEIQIRHKNGNIIWIDYVGGRIKWLGKDATMISAFDLTHQKELEERYKALADNTNEAIFFSQNGRGVDCNSTAEKMFGYTKDEVMNLQGTDVVAEEYKAIVLKRMLNNYQEKYEVIGKKKDGTLFPIEIQGTEINYKGKKTRVTVIRDITQAKLDKEKIAISEQKYNKLIESLSDCVFVVDTKGFFTYLSYAFENITQYKPEEFIGKHFLEGIAPEYHEKIIKMFTKGLAEKINLLYEVDILNKKGQKTPIELSVSTLLNKKGEAIGRIGTFRDITQRRKEQAELLKLQKAVAQSSSTIVITDTDGNITYVNEAFTKATGYSLNEVLGQNPRVLKSEYQSQEFYKELWDTIVSGNTWRGEFLNKKKNGLLFWERTTISPVLNKQGEIINYVAVKEDVTEEKKIREDLLIAKEKAEESEHLKTAFLQNMSHEIRTPLNGILGFAQLLKMEDIEEEDVFNYADIIEKSGHRLLELINNVLDISKIEAGTVVLNAKAFHLNQLLADIKKLMLIKFEKKSLYLDIQYGLPNEKDIILTDAGKLNQILINLINNALKFTTEGGVICSYFVKNNEIHFSVKDTGIGISLEEQEKIFSRFYQTDFTKNREFEGAGLGLAITKGLVNLLGGEIGVCSEKGKGTEFYFSIPYRVGEEINTEAISSKKYKLSGKELNILVAEDDNTSFLYLKKILEKFNVVLHHAENGIEAVNFCVINNPDIILMDINMPKMDGLTAAKLIKEKYPDIPIIAQTAFAFEDQKNEILKAGCDAFVAKPIIKEELFEQIKRFI